MLGLSDIHFKFLTKHLVTPFRREGATIWCFGSRARGDHQKYSDIDILLSPKSSTLEKEAAKVREFFAESNFPYKIDIVFEEDLASSYRQSALGDRIEIP